MQDINVVDSIHNAGSWLARNQELLLGYVVNIAAAIAILFLVFWLPAWYQTP